MIIMRCDYCTSEFVLYFFPYVYSLSTPSRMLSRWLRNLTRAKRNDFLIYIPAWQIPIMDAAKVYWFLFFAFFCCETTRICGVLSMSSTHCILCAPITSFSVFGFYYFLRGLDAEMKLDVASVLRKYAFDILLTASRNNKKQCFRFCVALSYNQNARACSDSLDVMVVAVMVEL